MNINAKCYRCGWEFGIETDEEIPAEHVPHICATCASVINLVVHEPEAPAELDTPTAAAAAYPVHYHGCCPVCHKDPVLMFARDHSEYMVCEEHRKAWYVGRGNFSAWQHMTEEDLLGQDFVISVECEIIPVPECKCTAPDGKKGRDGEIAGWMADWDAFVAAGSTTDGGADFERYVDAVAGELLAGVNI